MRPGRRGIDWAVVRGLVLSHRGDLVRAHLLALLATLATVPMPLLFPILVDEVLLGEPGPVVAALEGLAPSSWHGPWYYIGAILIVTLSLRLIALVLGVWETRAFTRISKNVIYRLRSSLLIRLERVSLAEYETLGSGGVSAKLVTDLETIGGFLGSTASRFMISVFSLAGIAAVLLWLNWQLALFILFLNPLVVYCTVVLGRRVKELKKGENRAIEVFQDSLTETLEAIHQIRASNRGEHYVQRLDRRAAAIRDQAVRFAWRSDAANRISFMIFLFGFDLFRAAAMLMVVFSDLTIGQMVAVFSYLWFLMTPVQTLLGIHYAFYSAQAAMQRVNQLMALEEEPRERGGEDPFSGQRTIGLTVDGLVFAYGAGPEVLQGVDLVVEAGEKVALVGASGGGKSTLVQVLLGLYPPLHGSVRYGGVPLENVSLQRLRENVAVVLQHPALFHDTIRNNLTLGRDLPEGRLWASLEVAQLADVVAELDGRLEARVGRHGVRFSGGQKQRLAIARMLLQDPKLIILDEATSALDMLTEQRLFEALTRHLDGTSLLLIAHRLSSLRFADRVYVFEDGRIAEHGRHDQLLSQDGLYAQLYAPTLAG